MRYAVMFAAVAAFGTVTKLPAAPVFVLALVLLPGWRVKAAYVLLAGAIFALFLAPAYGALDEFAEWIARVAMSAGAHGAGAQTVIDFDYYPKAVAKILKRPSLRVPLILGIVTMALVWWRSRQGAGGEIPASDVRGLVAVMTAQLTQVLVVGKHPVAFYMIPSYMLSALTLVLAARILWPMVPARRRDRVSPALVGAVALVVLAGVQAKGVLRLDGELEGLNAAARRLDNSRFEKCSRIYAASSRTFALYLADEVTGMRFSSQLKSLNSSSDYWIEDWYDQSATTFRNWDGAQDFTHVRNTSACLILRGNRPGGLVAFLKKEAPDMAYSTACSVGPEVVATVGVDCEGTLLK